MAKNRSHYSVSVVSLTQDRPCTVWAIYPANTHCVPKTYWIHFAVSFYRLLFPSGTTFQLKDALHYDIRGNGTDPDALIGQVATGEADFSEPTVRY